MSSHSAEPIRLGHPEYRSSVEQKYREFLVRFQRLQAAMSAVVERSCSDLDRRQLLLRDMLELLRLSVEEVITLVGNGMGHGAMKIVRNVVETAINAEYIRLNPKQADLYIEWHCVEDYKLNKYLQRYLPEVYQRISDEKRAKVDEEYKRVKPKFLDRKMRIRSNWCEHDLHQRAVMAGCSYEETYATVMPSANAILHGTIGAVKGLLDAEQAGGQLRGYPNDDWAKLALIAVHESALRMLNTASMALGVQAELDLASLCDDYVAIWQSAKGNEPLHRRSQ